MNVTLTGLEISLAVDVGNGRYYANRTNGVADEKIGNQSNGETDIQSAGAEIAFCKAHNLYPDLQLDRHLLADAVFPCGMTVDIKQTKRPDGRLLVRTTKVDKRCDAYVLVTGVLPEFRIAGGHSGVFVFRDCHIKDLGYGPTYALDQSALWPVDLLLAKYRDR